MYTLRPYQEDAVNAGLDFFLNSSLRAALMVLPTGSGKSLVIANIVKQLPGSTLIFQPSKEILEQNYDKLMSYDPMIGAEVFSASMKSKNIGKITYATIGSVINKKAWFEHFDNIIIDECHGVNPKEGMYDSLIKFLGRKKYLGLTATPYRLNVDGYGGAMLKFLTRTKPRVFEKLIYHCQIEELQREGFLAKLEYFSVGDFADTKLKINTTHQDYTDQSLREYYHEVKFDVKIADLAKRMLQKRKNLLIFTKFVDEAEKVKAILGDECGVVSAQTPSGERKQILTDFRAGKIRCVVNVGVLAVGFDFPELEAILLARTTRSLGLYYQMVGRVMRPHSDKESAWVVDMCQSYKMFGKGEELVLDRDGEGMWFFRNSKKKLTNVYMDEHQGMIQFNA